MAISWIDKAFGPMPDALELRARRSELLAGNLANADTPDYKARDIDFAKALAAARGGDTGGMALSRTRPGHLDAAPGAGGEPAAGYRVPRQPSLDGNTVETQSEQAAFADNAVRYQATLTFLNGRIKGLLTAIKGE